MRFFPKIARLCLLGFWGLWGLFAVPALAAPAAPGAPSTPLMRWHARIDAMRPELMRALFPKLIAHCRATATEKDLAGYFGLWRQSNSAVVRDDRTTAEARAQIETWRIYHCIATYFDGRSYYARPLANPNRTGGAPDMGWLEPVGALGKFFRAAQARDLLSFPTEAEETYFYERYDSAKYANMHDGNKAFDWFHTAPWAANSATP